MAKPFPYCAGDNCGLLDTAGYWIVEPKYQKIETPSKNGLSRYKSNGKFGYINTTTQKIVIKPVYGWVCDFASNGLACFEQNGKYGYINSSGTMVIPATFDEMGDFASNGLANVKQNGKYGYINSSGTMVIPATFDDADGFASNGLARVKQNGKYGFINSTGKFVLNGYTSVDRKSDDVYGLESSDGWYTYDITTQQKVATSYSRKDGVDNVVANGNGEVIWPKNYKQLLAAKNTERDSKRCPIDGLSFSEMVSITDAMGDKIADKKVNEKIAELKKLLSGTHGKLSSTQSTLCKTELQAFTDYKLKQAQLQKQDKVVRARPNSSSNPDGDYRITDGPDSIGDTIDYSGVCKQGKSFIAHTYSNGSHTSKGVRYASEESWHTLDEVVN